MERPPAAPAPLALALDLTRLTAGARRRTPRGIDRVELLYARHFLESWAGPCVSVLTAPWGSHIFDRGRALAAVEALERLWCEDGAPPAGRLRRAAARFLSIRPTLGRMAASALPPGAVYLNVGHQALSWPHGLDWLDQRRDVTAVFMLHDLIPLQHPDLVSPNESRYFARILERLPRADGLILNSQATADIRTLTPHLADDEILLAPLPVAPVFLAPRSTQAPRPERPYVVAYGQREARKNFQTLLRAWERLASLPGSPELIIVGAVDGDRTPAVSSRGERVREVSGLSTPALRELIRDAAAVLSPSLAEGAGLPIIEALTLGTPVLASDIPAHRETGNDQALYLSATDDAAWAAALRDHLADPAPLRARAAAYRPPTTDAYFARIEAHLRSLAAARRPRRRA